ncbi:MAG: hypothetical protein P8Y85_04335 [Nitrospirota bacterium]|jgi:hypothetical protein
MFDFIKKLAYIVSVVFIIYAGFRFGMPYYRYYAFKTDAADIVRFDFTVRDAEEEIRKDLIERAQELGVPIGANQINVYRTEDGYRVDAKWQETVDLLGQYQKTLSFEVEVGR